LRNCANSIVHANQGLGRTGTTRRDISGNGIVFGKRVTTMTTMTENRLCHRRLLAMPADRGALYGRGDAMHNGTKSGVAEKIAT
jgi:hypothetical protein